jgi:hypothetical protein
MKKIAVAAFAMFIVGEGACSSALLSNELQVAVDDDAGGARSDAAIAVGIYDCRAGETATRVGGHLLCCTGTSPLACRSAGPRIGDLCEPTDASDVPRTVIEANTTPATCINYQCPAPPTIEVFSSKTTALITPVVCVAGTLAASGAPTTTYHVEKACEDIEPGCGSVPESNDGSVTAPMWREPFNVLSTCATGSGPATPCTIEDF